MSKAKKSFNFAAKVSLGAGLKKTVQWYRVNAKNNKN